MNDSGGNQRFLEYKHEKSQNLAGWEFSAVYFCGNMFLFDMSKFHANS
jgi:hypothetical protein